MLDERADVDERANALATAASYDGCAAFAIAARVQTRRRARLASDGEFALTLADGGCYV